MRDTLTHRGPDDAGVWMDQNRRAGFGHRRLSIVDLSPAGRQPMSNEDGSIWITFNGEIYNHRELRGPLEAKGHRYRSSTDTETIVHLYEEVGESLPRHLDGMFAFALYDARPASPPGSLLRTLRLQHLRQLLQSLLPGRLLWLLLLPGRLLGKRLSLRFRRAASRRSIDVDQRLFGTHLKPRRIVFVQRRASRTAP